MTVIEHCEQEAGVADFAAGTLSARRVVDELVDAGLLDDLLSRVDDKSLALTGEGGFLPGLVKAVLQRGLVAELTDHLGYEKGDPAGRVIANSRNDSTPKMISIGVGQIELDVPRDRRSSFQPRLVAKGSRRLGSLDEMIILLYVGGMTICDIQHRLVKTLGTELSHETVSNITEAVQSEVLAWQQRPLDEIYPIMYLDALMVRVKDNHHVTKKAAYVATGVDLEGVKHVPGIWVQVTEGAKFQAGVCAELKNRGIKDTLMVCCDSLTGFLEAIEVIWPQATIQTCTVYLIGAAMWFVSYKDRRKVAAALRPIYTAPTAEAAETALLKFAESDLGKKYPSTVATWEHAWERFISFLAFPVEVHKIIYTTNTIKSLNHQLRKIIKNRGYFPNDAAVVKLLGLAICDIEDKRARARAKETSLARNKRKALPQLVEGASMQNWKLTLQALAKAYPERLTPYI